MIKNYIKIAWRNLTKNKVYSALNIVGLAAGMAVALLIGLWVMNEYSYDQFLPEKDQLYQVKMNLTSTHDGMHTQDMVALPLADILKKDYPEVKYVAEATLNWTHNLVVGDKKLYMDGSSVGSDFLKMFQFPLLKGNVNNVFEDPYSIVLTESTAKALFGNTDPIGKTVRIDTRTDVKVTGVMKDVPKNSSLQFNYLLPFSYNEQTQPGSKEARTNWGNNSFNVFVMLKPNVNFNAFSVKIKNITFKNGVIMRPAKPEIIMQRLVDWHLYSDFKNGKAVGGFIDYVRIFSIIGILVLLIACINFMNLSTARSEKRAREVGVRKAIGSQRSDLIRQFLTESILITFIAFVLAIASVQLALPAFNTLTETTIHIPYGNPVFWLMMMSYVLFTGLLAGSRPAFYLSSFEPVKVLKGAISIGKSASLPRKILVVIQFSCSIALIISTAIIYQQVNHARNRPTGYNRDRLVVTDMGDDLNEHYDALKNELMQTGSVENVARASSPVTAVYSHTTLTGWPGKAPGEESMNVATIRISNNYFNTTGMQLLAGNDFSSSWAQDTSDVILNEAAVARMGLKNPINQQIEWNSALGKVRIIGVVKNALMQSPFTPVQPAIFSHGNRGNVIIYRLGANVQIQSAIAKIEQLFKKYNPSYPFIYNFTDEQYNRKFDLEILIGKLAGIFAGLAIFISCLGLFGLAAYVAEQRTKEIGIRKVLGASITQVWVLLSTDFVVLVIISCLIASPIALYFLQGWLQKYDYRISIGPGVFVFSAMGAIAITMLTISFQSIKAALANPVRSLKNE